MAMMSKVEDTKDINKQKRQATITAVTMVMVVRIKDNHKTTATLMMHNELTQIGATDNFPTTFQSYSTSPGWSHAIVSQRQDNKAVKRNPQCPMTQARDNTHKAKGEKQY